MHIGKALLAALLSALLATALLATTLLSAAPAAAKTLGQWTQGDINEAIAHGIGFLETQQNADGSFGTTYPIAETSLAITSFGVEDGGHFAKLTPTQQAAVQRAVGWLISQQDPTTGVFGTEFYETYDTGLALLALSFSDEVPTTPPDAVAHAIEEGRRFLLEDQQTGNGVSLCQSSGPLGSGLGGQSYCGGWNYTPGGTRSDESNTGFAVTGLASTGGVPAAAAALNLGWQRNVQEFSGNTYGSPTLRDDGGASYEPGINEGDFSSNANDSGTNLFSFGFDGVPGGDPAVQALLKFDGDVLDAYELQQAHLLEGGGSNSLDAMHMIFHSGATEDGACTPDASGCDWHTAPGEGGYHYSLFSLTKGFSQYLPAELSNPENYYAKVVDLLLEQQHTSGAEAGSWPTDPRDDPTPIIATGFAILALGRVGAPAQISGTVYEDTNGNGTRDSGEAGLGGWTVFVDVNGSDNPAGQPQALTAADGSYSIQNLPEGSFPVRIVGQAGYTCTQPSGCSYTEKFTSDVNLTELDFGEHKPVAATTATTTTTTTTAAAATPQPVSAVQAVGAAHLARRGLACVTGAGFLASVVGGASIASVTFTLDGHQVTVLHAPVHGLFATRIFIALGTAHHLTVHVVFTPASHMPAQTLTRTLVRCLLHHLRRVRQPRFTG
jgi:hypothetical protein